MRSPMEPPPTRNSRPTSADATVLVHSYGPSGRLADSDATLPQGEPGRTIHRTGLCEASDYPQGAAAINVMETFKKQAGIRVGRPANPRVRDSSQTREGVPARGGRCLARRRRSRWSDSDVLDRCRPRSKRVSHLEKSLENSPGLAASRLRMRVCRLMSATRRRLR